MCLIYNENTDILHVYFEGAIREVKWGGNFPKVYNYILEGCQNVGEIVNIAYIKDNNVYQREIYIDEKGIHISDELFSFAILIENPIDIKCFHYNGPIVISDNQIQRQDEILSTNKGNSVVYWNHGYFVTEDEIMGIPTKGIKFTSAYWNTCHLFIYGIYKSNKISIAIYNKTKKITGITYCGVPPTFLDQYFAALAFGSAIPLSCTQW